VRAYHGALVTHRAALNRLNVYPVPDGDTGTNMGLTLQSVIAEMDAAPAPLTTAALAQCLSHGSLMGARGNSGVILSQVLRGLAGAFRDARPEGQVHPADLVEAFSRASDSAYAAVSNPVEGTILTVARAAAQGAETAISELDEARRAEAGALGAVLAAARAGAAHALAGTTEQLPALRAAGVVDAGGAGLLLLFDSFLFVVDGRPIEPPPPAPGTAVGAGTTGAAGTTGLPYGSGGAGAGGDLADQGPMASARTLPALAPQDGAGLGNVAELRYEVMFFLEAPDESVPAFRSVWEGCGGSIVIVGGDGLYNCHIHTDDVGVAIEAAIEIGRPRQIRVTDLRDQVEEERWVRDAAASGAQLELADEPVNCAVVAVCAGEGVKRILRSLGARQLVSGGQSANPSTAEILSAITAVSAEQVIVLPNNVNVVAVAEQAASHSQKKVRVVPTAGIPEGFAALLAYDPEADVDINADNMASAAAHIVAGEVAQASRPALTEVGPVGEGDWLGMSRQGIKVIASAPSTPADAAIALLEVLLPEPQEYEIITIIEGEGSHPADTRRIVEWAHQMRPGVSTEVHHGGQPLYPYLFSIE
jgi:hypothetical protein